MTTFKQFLQGQTNESAMSDAHVILVDEVAKHFKVDHEMAQEIVDWMLNNGMGDDSAAYMFLYDYYMDKMPYGIQKARTGDPDEWIADRLHDEFGELIPESAGRGEAVDTDKLLAYFREGTKKAIGEIGFDRLDTHGRGVIDDIFQSFRKPLMAGDVSAFINAYTDAAANDPDYFDMLMDEVFAVANVKDIDALFKKVGMYEAAEASEKTLGQKWRERYNELMTLRHTRTLTRKEMDELQNLEDVLYHDKRDR